MAKVAFTLVRFTQNTSSFNNLLIIFNFPKRYNLQHKTDQCECCLKIISCLGKHLQYESLVQLKTFIIHIQTNYSIILSAVSKNAKVSNSTNLDKKPHTQRMAFCRYEMQFWNRSLKRSWKGHLFLLLFCFATMPLIDGFVFCSWNVLTIRFVTFVTEIEWCG